MSPCRCPLCGEYRQRYAVRPKMLNGPLPWYRRMSLADWLFVAVCLMLVAAFVYPMGWAW